MSGPALGLEDPLGSEDPIPESLPILRDPSTGAGSGVDPEPQRGTRSGARAAGWALRRGSFVFARSRRSDSAEVAWQATTPITTELLFPSSS